MTPKVSVVMPVYNGARYLRPALDSILYQSLTDFEFIVVNDGSTDGTAVILEEYNDNRLVLLNNEKNAGLVHSLNWGIESAQAKYIVRQDADDISYPDRLEKLKSFLDRNPEIGVVGSAVEWIDVDSQPSKVWPQGQNNVELQQLLLRTCPLIHGSTAYRRSCFDEVGGYDAGMQTVEDYDFWLRVSESWDLICLPDILYQYRQHEDMVSVRHQHEQSKQAAEALNSALARRREYIWKAIYTGNIGRMTNSPGLGRRWLARRYIWWAKGARYRGIWITVSFLLAALLLDPACPELWRYMRDTFARKTGLETVA